MKNIILILILTVLGQNSFSDVLITTPKMNGTGLVLKDGSIEVVDPIYVLGDKSYKLNNDQDTALSACQLLNKKSVTTAKPGAVYTYTSGIAMLKTDGDISYFNTNNHPEIQVLGCK